MAVYLTSSSSTASADATYQVAQDATLGEEGAEDIHGAPATELQTGSHAQEAKLPQLRFDTFPSQVFWLAVVFLALYVILQRSLLPRIHQVLETRPNRIQQDLDRAAHYQQEAATARAAFEKTQTEARLHVQSVMDDVAKRAKDTATAQQHAMDTTLRASQMEADAKINSARDTAIAQANTATTALAEAIVERLVNAGADNAARPARRA